MGKDLGKGGDRGLCAIGHAEPEQVGSSPQSEISGVGTHFDTPPHPGLFPMAPWFPTLPGPTVLESPFLSFQVYLLLLQRQQAECRNILKVSSRLSEVSGQAFVSLRDTAHSD